MLPGCGQWECSLTSVFSYLTFHTNGRRKQENGNELNWLQDIITLYVSKCPNKYLLDVNIGFTTPYLKCYRQMFFEHL